MQTLTDRELMNIKGGFKAKIFIAAASAITFLIGIIDGYIRPLKCNS
jgi:bacteriocin-like protein